jgi:hypothetical protein
MTWRVWVGRAPFRPRTDLRSFTDLAEAQAAGEHRADSWCRAHPDLARTASTCQGSF